MAKEITITYWIAFDGTSFNSEEECQAYELQYTDAVYVYNNYETIIKNIGLIDFEENKINNFPSKHFTNSTEAKEFWQKLKAIGKTIFCIRIPQIEYINYISILFNINLPREYWIQDDKGYNWYSYITNSKVWTNFNKNIVDNEFKIAQLNSKLDAEQ